MKCPVQDCSYEYTPKEFESDPYIAYKILDHIINSHKLVEAKN